MTIDPAEPVELRDLFAAQHLLQTEAYKRDPQELEGEERTHFISWNVLALTDELHEVLAEVGWKPWASSRHVNEEAVKGELVDAFHFFMNLCIVVGMPADELAERYWAKRAINAKRQAEGYDGVSTKCPGCGRAYDDASTPCYPENPTNQRFCTEKGLGF